MSSMSETTEIKDQNGSDSDEHRVQMEAKCETNDQMGNGFIRSDIDNCVESHSKTIESEFAICGTNGTTGMTRINVFNGMRDTDSDSTQAPDVCSGSQCADTSDGANDVREEPSQDSQTLVKTVSESDNEVLIIETVVKCDSSDVTLITDTTLKTTSHPSNQSLVESLVDCRTETKSENNSSSDMTTTTTSRPKQLKSLLKRSLKEKSIKTVSNGRRVTFSETMQVFCDDWPQNLMPQIIALKSPTDFNLVEVQGYMFEPPVEYQDFLPFEPPPDYRDFIANSLCAFDRDLTINYIDEEEEDDNNDSNFLNEMSLKWESMILNNNESLEEEQIIGVLKEDAILQAIGSHISLPEEHLCPEDFPIHFQCKDSNAKTTDSELSDITSDDGNDCIDSSPTGSLQDIQSDSSITSQDTIILMNESKDDKDLQIFSNKNSFNEMNTSFDEDINSESVVKSDDILRNSELSANCLNNDMKFESNKSVICEMSDKSNAVVGGVEGVDSAADVAHDMDTNEVQTTGTVSDDNNSDRKQLNLFSNHKESNDYSNAFKRNLMFYENMFSDKRCDDKPEDIPPKQSHTVSHFVIQNTPKFPIITQNVSKEKSIKTIESSDQLKQMPNEVKTKPMNNCQPMASIHPRAPTLQPTQHNEQTQPNPNNWSTDEFIIEYTSEPKALVPSKRTASLSNFCTAQTTPHSQPIRTNVNNNDIHYLSLNRNGEIPKQWNSYNIDLHNSSQQIQYPFPPNQRSLSPNPIMSSANPRPPSPQPVFYRTRPQFIPQYTSNAANATPVHLMYNCMSGTPTQQRVSVRVPVMSQAMGAHKQPPPYSYHIQQHSNEFPNPSEIRRRDGLNAYPHVLHQTPQAGDLPVPPINHNQNNLSHPMTKDELEQFVQQDIQRTERIKKRYSMTEEDDPSFGFARRPSVRGIRPKFGTTNEILKQMQTQSNCLPTSGTHIPWTQSTQSMNNISNNQISSQQNQSFLLKPHIVQIRVKPHNSFPIKYMSEMSVPDALQSSQSSHPSQGSTAPVMCRTLPRPQSLICQSHTNSMRTEDGLVIRLPVNASRDQLKQQIQRQLEQQQTKMKTNMSSMSSMPATNAMPVMSSNDERGAPEGASSSPKHTSDVLFAKNMMTTPNLNPKSVETAVNNKTTTNRQQTNDTKKLVINDENKVTDDSNEGIIYYSMNV